MTLTELAYKLKEIFPRTKYVTAGSNNKSLTLLKEEKIVSIFYDNQGDKPVFITDYIHPNSWGIRHKKLTVGKYPFYSPGIHQFYLHEISNLELSEYKDESGNVDYSKCIVEVE